MTTTVKPWGIDPSKQFTFDSIATSTVVVGNVAISDSGNGGIQVASVAANGEIGTPAPVTGGGAGVTVYNSINDLPLSGVDAGAMALVLGSPARMYVRTDTGWFNIALINTNPSITQGPEATYVLDNTGTPTVITLQASDPEGIPITWSYQVTSGSLGNTATVSQSNNMFTITPSNNEADAGTFELTFTATDGVNLDTAVSSFVLRFGVDWNAAVQQAKLTASDAQQADWFGNSVSIDGDTAIVGAHLKDNGSQFDAGAAYFYTRTGNTWAQQAKVISGDPASDEQFGYSVDVSGDTAVIGARLDKISGENAGAAYVFVRSGSSWGQSRKIVSNDLSIRDWFGHSVAISSSGNDIIVGAPFEDINYYGAAYIFTKSGFEWPQQIKLNPTQWVNAYFGWAVDIDGDTAVVGANRDLGAGSTSSGSAYVFTRSGGVWSQQAKLVGPTGNQDDFGVSVSVSGDTIVVGAMSEDVSGVQNRGAAYVFVRSGTTWTQQAKLTASDGTADAYFGSSVSISGNTVVVGAYFADSGATSDAGKVYIFTRSSTSWTETKILEASDKEVQGRFGNSVRISEDSIIVGSPTSNTGSLEPGGAYVFVGQ